jgi:hypothetical protein
MIKAYEGRCNPAGKISPALSLLLLPHVETCSLKKMKEITRNVARVREFVQDLPSTTMEVFRGATA